MIKLPEGDDVKFTVKGTFKEDKGIIVYLGDETWLFRG